MRRRLLGVLCFGLGAASLAAQPPDGWYVVSSAEWVGTAGSSRAPGGLFLVPPRAGSTPLAVQGLTSELTGRGTPFLSGASAVSVRPDDGVLYVGEAGRQPETIELHEIALAGTAAATVRKTPVGTPNPLELWGGITQIAVLRNGDAVFSVQGLVDAAPLFGWPVGYFERATGAVRPLPYGVTHPSIVIAPNASSVAVDEATGLVYAVVARLAGFSGQLLEFPLAGGNARFLNVFAGATGMAFNSAGKLVSSKQSDVIEIDPSSGAWTTSFTAPSGIVGLTVEVATDRPLYLIMPQQVELWRLGASGSSVKVATGITGSASGIAVAADPVTYGRASPGLAAYRWRVAPNPGGLPLAGNAAFGLQVESSSGNATGIVLVGSAPVSIPLGFELLVSPVFSFALPAHGSIALPLPPTLPVGASVLLQSLHLDAGAPWGLASSEGCRVTIL